MNELVSNKKNTVILIGLLVLLLLFALYYFLISPLKNERDTKEVTVEVLKGEVKVLRDEYNTFELDVNSDENVFKMKDKVPLERELDQLLLSLEEVELLSDSKIESIEFNNYDGIIDEAQLALYPVHDNTEDTEKVGEVTEDTEDNETTEANEEALEELPISSVSEITLPANLKLITFNVTVQTKNYEHLVLLIEEIENLERVLRVDQITMNAPGEQELLDQELPTATSATIQLTTFFHKE
ncbi:hypothetical protein MKX96_08145 [Psychrobacillus sp. FSL W7-1493]|uniref:hypothetical protein n=1 Tax=Psychrobacillus sp. FSL W7-1493 TaxID=2921552 RepID=UPI0030FC5244